SLTSQGSQSESRSETSQSNGRKAPLTVDILNRLSWSHYKPADAPHCVRIFHHKTKVLYDLPLYDDDGTALFPELTSRLDRMPRLGTLIVTREALDRTRKIHLPWQPDYFRHSIAKIRQLAGIDENVKFMGIRHGGNVEGANAGLTEAQLRSLSGHKNAGTMIRYAQETPDQQRAGARKCLIYLVGAPGLEPGTR
ncbi:hypothetical protein, partial [Bradyrhizobium liaoningense]